MLETTRAAEAVSLSAQHLYGEMAEEDGVESFYLVDGEECVEINHEIGNLELSARQIIAAGQAMIEYGERLRYRDRMRTAGWT